MEQVTDHDAWNELRAQKQREAGAGTGSDPGQVEGQGPLGAPMSDEEAQELLNDPELFDPEWEHEALSQDESPD